MKEVGNKPATGVGFVYEKDNGRVDAYISHVQKWSLLHMFYKTLTENIPSNLNFFLEKFYPIIYERKRTHFENRKIK